MAKPNPNKVRSDWAEKAMAAALVKHSKNALQATYSEYIIVCFRATGNLNCGCDAKDLFQWYKENLPEQYKVSGSK